MINKKQKYQDAMHSFWENCDETFAHLKINRWLDSETQLYKFWASSFLSELEFKNKTVVDYGIGGGYLGKLLLQNYDIQNYTGYDIAQRSLDHASNNLKQFSKKKYNLLLVNKEFKLKRADIFISQACIQHFPTKCYLEDFLRAINSNNYVTIVLQIRFSPFPHITPDNPTLSCWTNHFHIQDLLGNYDLVHASNVEENFYQYLIYKIKKSHKNDIFPKERYNAIIEAEKSNILNKATLSSNITILKDELSTKEKCISSLKRDLKKIKQSPRYKFGSAIAAPYRKIKSLFKL